MDRWEKTSRSARPAGPTRLRGGVVPARPARAGAPALLRRALRGGRGQLDVLRGSEPAHRRALGGGHAGRVHVRRQAAPAALAPLADAGRLATFLLQLSPGFSPHRHELDELAPLVERLAPHPVAIEPRHRSWVKGERLERTLAWMEDHGAIWVGVDAPNGRSITIMPPVDAVTHPRVAYLRAHGRNAEGYVRGRSVAERMRELLGQASAATAA